MAQLQNPYWKSGHKFWWKLQLWQVWSIVKFCNLVYWQIRKKQKKRKWKKQKPCMFQGLATKNSPETVEGGWLLDLSLQDNFKDYWKKKKPRHFCFWFIETVSECTLEPGKTMRVGESYYEECNQWYVVLFFSKGFCF